MSYEELKEQFVAGFFIDDDVREIHDALVFASACPAFFPGPHGGATLDEGFEYIGIEITFERVSGGACSFRPVQLTKYDFDEHTVSHVFPFNYRVIL